MLAGAVQPLTCDACSIIVVSQRTHRDGKPSECILYYCYGDKIKMEQMMAGDLHGDRCALCMHAATDVSTHSCRVTVCHCAGGSSAAPSRRSRFSCTRRICCGWCHTAKTHTIAGDTRSATTTSAASIIICIMHAWLSCDVTFHSSAGVLCSCHISAKQRSTERSAKASAIAILSAATTAAIVIPLQELVTTAELAYLTSSKTSLCMPWR